MGLFDGKINELGEKLSSAFTERGRALLHEALSLDSGKVRDQTLARAAVLMDISEVIAFALKDN